MAAKAADVRPRLFRSRIISLFSYAVKKNLLEQLLVPYRYDSIIRTAPLESLFL